MNNSLIDNMPKISWFKFSIQEFISKLSGEILDELTKFEEGSAEIIQRDALQDQINLLKDIHSNFKQVHMLIDVGVGARAFISTWEEAPKHLKEASKKLAIGLNISEL